VLCPSPHVQAEAGHATSGPHAQEMLSPSKQLEAIEHDFDERVNQPPVGLEI
jgi:hypothetical protein